ncbi:MAG: thermonuclease family protein [Roseobacter sp.]
MVRVVFWVLSVLWGGASFAQEASNITGTVIVVDGDTIDVNETRVRLFGIDAPENDQTCTTEQGADWSCGAWVTEAVIARFDGQPTTCTVLDTDRYSRAVARCWVNGQDIAQSLVQDGLAFAYRRYSMDYDLDEKRAAVGDVGLHASRVQTPAQFRQTRAKGRIPPDRACRIKGNISSAGARIYHIPGQRDYERTGIRENRGERWFCSAQEAEAAGWRAARR